MIAIRLQGGPHDGDRQTLAQLERDDFGAQLFVLARRDAVGPIVEWFLDPVEGAEIYRRDEEIDGDLVYVWTDQDLYRHLELTQSVLALGGES